MNQTAELLLDAFDGDYIAAFLFCEKLGGVTLSIPRKAMRTYLASKMLENGFNVDDVVATAGISKRTAFQLRQKRTDND